MLSRNIYIVAAKRTPFGAFGGSLKDVSATDLGVVAAKAALEPLALSSPPQACYVGSVLASSSPYIARHVGLQAGMKHNSTALTINRLCGSGFETVIQATKAIACHEGSLMIAGGTENMSAAPLQITGTSVRWGVPLGQGLKVTDALWDGLTDSLVNTPMGMTAENLAAKYNISRQECDEYAIRSQQLWSKANEAGIFEAEIAPVEVKTKKGQVVVSKDEHPRPETTLDKIAKLPPVFKKDGAVTAANASGICDGAGCLIVASEEAVREHSLTPLARIVSYAVTGCDPTIMGIGPVDAIRQALDKAGLNLHNDVDCLEINEAFAAQFLACAKELELDMSKTNLHGGAISMGHPLAASGSRILAHLTHEFAREPDNEIHVGAACIGGGQGIAVVLERC